MNLYLNGPKNNVFIDSIALALEGYFSAVYINESDDVGDAEGNCVKINVDDDKAILIVGGRQDEFQSPLKIGDVLQKIQIELNNQRVKRTSAPINIGQHVLRPDSNILQMGADEIALTDKEFDIIIKIFQSSPKRIARDELLHAIWGYSDQIETHTLETHIYRLRQKVEKDPSNPTFLKTDDDGYYLNF